MDERELEGRLRRRLHDRFDEAGPSDALRLAVARTLSAEAQRAPGPRFAAFLSTSRLLASAAAIALVVVAALVLRSSGPVVPGGTTPSVGPSGAPAPSSTAPASASPAPSPSPAVLTPTMPPVSTTAWAGLEVNVLAGAPAAFGEIVPWSRGYLGFTAMPGGRTTAWTSPDGRAWTRLPASTFGLDDPTGTTLVLGGAPCADRVLVLVGGGPREVLWSSSDGAAWTSTPFPGSGNGKLAGLAGGASGAIAPADSGLALEATSDCATWHRVALPGPAEGSVRAVAAFNGGFVAVGFAGQATSSAVEPLAWWSPDGARWSAAAVPARRGDGFMAVWAGSAGLVSESTQPAFAPGVQSSWSSRDGQSWTYGGPSPLGRIASGQGVGSVAGTFVGDGSRILAYGTALGDPGPIEYWVSADGSAWTRLTLAGGGAKDVAADDTVVPFLMRDGVLFSGGSATWFGAAVGP